MPVLIVGILFLLISAFASVAADALTAAKNSRRESLVLAQAAVSSAVNRYAFETGSYPTSTADLMAKPTYEYLKTYASSVNGGAAPGVSDIVQIAQSSVLNDGFWTYRRATVFALENRTEQSTTFLGSARNKCPAATGSTDFATSLSWCSPTDNGFATSVEQRAQANARTSKALVTQQFTLTKFVTRYKTAASFPPAASAVTLRTVVSIASPSSSVGTTPATCAGIFQWQTIPFECADLYNRFGQPVSYLLSSAKSIVLTSPTTLTNGAGATPSLSTSITMP